MPTGKSGEVFVVPQNISGGLKQHSGILLKDWRRLVFDLKCKREKR